MREETRNKDLLRKLEIYRLALGALDVNGKGHGVRVNKLSRVVLIISTKIVGGEFFVLLRLRASAA